MLRAEYRVLINGEPGRVFRSKSAAHDLAEAYRAYPPAVTIDSDIPWDIRVQTRLVATGATKWVNTRA